MGVDGAVSVGSPRSSAAAEGVDARGIAAFLDAVAATGTELHSIMVLRHDAEISDPRSRSMRVRHVAAMASGHEDDVIGQVRRAG